jgi:hypothetical protein
MLFLVKKIPGEKGSEGGCVVMVQHSVLLSPKFWGVVLAHFQAIAVIRHIIM